MTGNSFKRTASNDMATDSGWPAKNVDVTSASRDRLTDLALDRPSASFSDNADSSAVDASLLCGVKGMGRRRAPGKGGERSVALPELAGDRRSPLVSIANKKATQLKQRSDKRETMRVFAEQVRAVHKRFNEDSRWASCGNPMASRVGIGRSENSRVSASGIETCGSAASCIRCRSKIASQRCTEIETGLRNYLKRDSTTVLFTTFTLPHYASDSIDDVWAYLKNAWTALINTRSWRGFKKRYKLDGFIKVIEPTIGANGHHLHIHCLFLFNIETDEAYQGDWLNVAKYLHDNWKRGVLKSCGRTISGQAGVDIRAVRDEAAMGEYLSKVAFEVTDRAFAKKGKSGNRTPWEIVRDFLDTGDSQDLAIWLDWCRASKGRRLISWSRYLKKELGVTEETDEAIAGKEDETRVIEGYVCFKTWYRLGQRVDGARARFMHVWEQDGPIHAGNYLSKIMPDQFGLSISDEGLPYIRVIKKQTPTSPKAGECFITTK